MKYIVSFFLAFMFFGCSATVKGVKEDTSNAVDWTKKKVNEAATVVKEKTE
ncbi:MAG TPA: hypothetical protein PKW30_03250 [Campylobacterales bacterium]|nr:hypothetical protein [Campylobacterales bacterium]